MARRKDKTVRNDNTAEWHSAMARLLKLYDKLSDVSQEGIRLKYLTTDKELAAEIRQTVAALNKQISVANQRGIIINLSTNPAWMADCPPLQAEIYERKDL